MLKNKTLFIALYGIDGSGKTTLALLLANKLRKRRVKVYIVKLRAHHTLMYLLLRIFFLLKRFKYGSIQGKPVLLNYLVKRHLGHRKLYIALEVFGVIAWFLIEIFPKKIFGRKPVVFIADRFLPDFIVMLRYTSNIDENELLKLYKFLEKLMPISVTYFYVYVDPYIAVARKKEEKLHSRFTLYLTDRYEWINRYLQYYMVNTTNRKPHESMMQVLSYLENLGIVESDIGKQAFII